MTTSLRSVGLAVAVALLCGRAPARRRLQPRPPTPALPTHRDDDRPATTTFFGDTGLWFVPTAEVLPHGKWSVSGYRRGTNYIQGYTNVADFAGTFAVGIRDRAEIFGSFLVDTRIDRDVAPALRRNDPTFGGFVDRYPRVNQGWTGDNVGDFYVGAKINLLSESRQKPAALAVRGMVKLPTGDEDVGRQHRQGGLRVRLHRQQGSRRSSSKCRATAATSVRGEPGRLRHAERRVPLGRRRRLPVAEPAARHGELNGERAVERHGDVTGVAARWRRRQPARRCVVDTENLTRATVGLTCAGANGFFVGAGVSWNVPTKARSTRSSDDRDDAFGDYCDWQVRIGYHPGVRVYVPPPPAAAAAAPAAAAAAPNRPPTVQARLRSVHGGGRAERRRSRRRRRIPIG